VNNTLNNNSINTVNLDSKVMTMSINNIVKEFFPEAKLLASGFQGSVYALNETIVIKAIVEGLSWQVASGDFEPVDKLAMQWANNVNGLVIKYKDHIQVEDVGDLIATERVYPCVVTAFTKEQIMSAIDVAEAQLEELWASGWAHCDLKRPEMVKKVYKEPKDDILFNNIVLTKVNNQCVIRLIDIGTANLEQYDEDDEIEEHIDKDRGDWQSYKDWILNYPRQH
jgi:hypothetical protein